MQSTRSTQVRSTRTRKALAATGIVLAGLSLGTGVAGAFPNGPVVIQDTPPPLPDPHPAPHPQGPDQIADAPADPDQPWQGPDGFAIPDPGPVQPVPAPGPQQGGGNGGGQQGGGDQAAPAGPSAEDFAAIAGALAADEASVASEGDELGVEDVTIELLGRGEPRETDGEELAAGDLAAETSESSVPMVLAALATALIAGLLALWFVIARRRDDEDQEGATA